ncbi:hypothetical protein SAMN04487995_2170 [Dyadobacter koreensis]|uniref:Chromate transporter n=1 Tax=Dyadobacter koreensis TaxID=408657 RepID=A0A1H6TF21_9BACT|nr:hypothetical protein [Dyadobacter koreensis]SEI77886.1 hypothetical protein SAMN04487995_2170 [Dyadobacter koreensis]
MGPRLILENELEPIFLGKFPPFPDDVKEFLVKYGPYFILVAAVFMLFGLLAAFGIGTAAIGIGVVAYGSGFMMYIGLLIAAIIAIIYLMAFSPLRARKKAGWNLMYYALILSLLSSLIQLALLSVLIGGVLGFWVLFQIRDKYIL